MALPPLGYNHKPETLIHTCNQYAISALKSKDFPTAKDNLRRAEFLLKANPSPTNSRLWILTFNTYNRYFKQSDSLAEGVSYFTNSLQLHSSCSTLGVIHLHISILQSKLGNFTLSTSHAHQCLSFLKKHIYELPSAVAKAYFYLAFAHEQLLQYKEAEKFYKEGWDYSSTKTISPSILTKLKEKYIRLTSSSDEPNKSPTNQNNLKALFTRNDSEKQLGAKRKYKNRTRRSLERRLCPLVARPARFYTRITSKVSPVIRYSGPRISPINSYIPYIRNRSLTRQSNLYLIQKSPDLSMRHQLVKLQAAIRCWQARKRYLALRNSAIRLQTWSRRHFLGK